MNHLKLTIFLLGVVFFSNNEKALALDDELINISNGSCWLSRDEFNLKYASFNEKLAFNRSFELVNEEMLELINKQFPFMAQVTLAPQDFSLHCGGYGSSIVVKLDSDQGRFCLWTKVVNNQLAIRSFGSVDSKDKREFCHGRKWGELILGMNLNNLNLTLNRIKQLHADKIESVELITNGVYKLVLKENWRFKEEVVRDELAKDFKADEIRYIEFNEFSHPIGDYFKLK